MKYRHKGPDQDSAVNQLPAKNGEWENQETRTLAPLAQPLWLHKAPQAGFANWRIGEHEERANLATETATNDVTPEGSPCGVLC